MITFIYPPIPLDKTGLATEAEQIVQTALLQEIADNTDLIETKQDAQTTLLTSVDSATTSIDSKVSTAALQTAGNASLVSIDSKLTAPLQVRAMNELIPAIHDYVSITSKNANGDPLIIVYKTGGASGTTVATLTLTYDVDGDLSTVTRT
jgi:hypothetical protein